MSLMKFWYNWQTGHNIALKIFALYLYSRKNYLNLNFIIIKIPKQNVLWQAHWVNTLCVLTGVPSVCARCQLCDHTYNQKYVSNSRPRIYLPYLRSNRRQASMVEECGQPWGHEEFSRVNLFMLFLINHEAMRNFLV